MVGSHVFAVLALTLSAVASAAPTDKTFKFGVIVNDKTYYLQANGQGTATKAQGVDCLITSGKLSCDGMGAPAFRGDMVQLKLSRGSGSSGWTLDKDTIQWENKKFSLYKGTTDIYAESCSTAHGHFPTHGSTSAKAYFN